MKKVLIILLVLLLIGGAGAGALFYVRSSTREPVGVYPVSNLAMTEYWGDSSQTGGFITAEGIQSVFLSDTQKVTEVFVHEGDTVSEGDPLLSYDTTLSDIALERKAIAVDQLEKNLQDAQYRLYEIYSYTPYVPPAPPEPEPEPQKSDPKQTPYRIGGTGGKSDPIRYLWGKSDAITEEFLTQCLGEGSDVYIVFEVRKDNILEEEMTLTFGMHVTQDEEGKRGIVVYDPEAQQAEDPENPEGNPENPDEPQPEPEPIPDPGPQYTAYEIAVMAAEQKKTIQDLDLNLRISRVEYERAKAEKDNSVVTAKFGGRVSGVIDEETARMNSLPMMTVSDGGGYYVTGTLGEFELTRMQPGQEVTVTSWMDGMEYTAVITEISEYPSQNGYSYGGGNSNVSYYPFKAMLEEGAGVSEGQYVDVRYSAQEKEQGFYLEAPYIRSENGKDYVFVKGADGRLEKRYIRTGKSLWGSQIQILGGLSLEEEIAFPYGKFVTEGAETREGSMEELYG